VRAAQLAAIARAHLDAADLPAARQCARAARSLDPSSARVALDAALVFVATRELQAAADALRAAAAPGVAGPELHEAQALLAAAQGDEARVREAGRAAGTFEGRLLAAAAGDGESAAALDAPAWPGRRGAWSAAARALYAHRWGRTDARRGALEQTRAEAETARVYELVLAVRRARAGLDAERWGPVERAFAKVGAGLHTNPAWVSTPRDAQAGAFTQLEAGVGLVGHLGAVSLRGRVDALQRVFVTARDELQTYDLSGLSGAVALGVPIGADPTAARLSLDARFTGAWIDDGAQAVGSLLEAGPDLSFRVASQAFLHLAFYGVRYDFDSSLAPTEGGAPGNERDFVGQRAVVGLAWEAPRASARLDAVFTAQQAQTPAFDALGGGFAGEVRVWASERLWTRLEISAWIRDFGPSARPGPVGEAQTRSEVRSRFGLELGLRLADAWSLVLRDDFVATFAREGTDYDANVARLGLEVAW